MTMSTNLGWPSEPEPGPEHRRLGWLARMLGVSRETNDAAPTEPLHGTAGAGPDEVAAGAEEPAPSGIVDVRSALDTTHDPVDDGAPAGGDLDPSGRDAGSTADDEVVASGLSSAGGLTTQTGSDTEAPGVQPDPVESGHDLPGADEAPVSAQTVSAVDRSDGAEAEPTDSEEGAPSEETSVQETADASLEADPTEGGGVRSVPSTPVDNAVDDSSENAPVEQEITPSEAGDNAVDEARRASELKADHADREALAAAIPTAGQDTPLAMELAENARRRIQLTGRPFPRPVSPRVLTVANQKGGVGKTTTTVNVAAALAQSGLKALVIDLDPQGNASTALGIDHHAEVPSIYDVLVEGTPLLEVVQRCTTVENLYCAPATIDLAGAEIELVSLVARESRLQKAIAAAAETGHEFDYILIDCPPSLGLLTVNAMVAASEVFIPIQCEYYALEGLSQLLKNIDLVKRHLNPALHVSTILLTMYDGRTRLSAQVADEVREHFPTEVLRTSVPRSVRVSEAPSFGETVMTYDPASSGALAYLEAAGEIADRGAAGRT